ncbi:MAG: glycoside hydrolase family 3 C-terminal domain-containing protein [Bacilli bacterium]|nr:glycoside hydrolase family 3 C-terminal domain-containing protein [Bacilli bacterium]
MSKSKLLKVFGHKCWEPLMVVFGGLFMVSLVANAATVPFNNELHGFFHTSAYEEVKVEGAEDSTISRPKLKSAEEIEAYYRAINQEVESEGLVLLKNENNALPLAANSKVAFALSGTGRILYATHGPGVRRDGEKDGAFYDLRRALKEETNLQVNDATYDFLATGAGKTNRGQVSGVFRTGEVDWKTYAPVVSQYDDSTVIAVITRESGEGVDVNYTGSDGVDGSYLSLTANELGILENLATLKQQGKVKKIVVLINSAVDVRCDFLDDERYGVDAAMWIGLPGATGMKGVADALVGKVNPSGRLSDTFVKDNFSAPSAQYWKLNQGFAGTYGNADDMGLNLTQKFYGVYAEGIYVGYRYYETRYEDVVLNRGGVGNFVYKDVVAYPFGHGLSYSTFAYSAANCVENKDKNGKTTSYDFTVTVQNTGAVAGKEAVQVYLQKPYSRHDIIVGMEKASVELAGFAKTKVLAPGESETLTINVDFEQLRSYDAEADKTYILDEGDYYLTAAKDSHHAVNNILAAKGYAASLDSAGDASLSKKILSNPTVDAEIFSKSSAHYHDTPSSLADEPCNVPITNRLDWMDPNRFKGVKNAARQDGEVVYVSRNNWTATFPSEATNLVLTGKGPVKYDITSHKPIVEAEGAKMPTYGDSSTPMTLPMMEGVPYNDEQWGKILNNLTQQETFETLVQCYGYTPGIPSIAKPMTDEDDGPYGVSNTAEGYSSMSCEGIICATLNKEIIAKVGEAIAADARSGHDEAQKNLHGLYAPGLNIHRAIFGGRAAEYYSEDPYLTGIAAWEEIEAMQEQYVVACPKHYIFNDEEDRRNGICIWMNEQAAREIYLTPWEYAVRPDKANAHSLMTSFNRAGAIWTSASDDLMEHILREEWGFDGYTLTDMAGSNGKMFMVYDDGFMNGTDCFLDKGTYKEGMTSAMRSSPTFNLKLRESMKRLLYTVANYSAAMDGFSNSTRLVAVVVPWQVGLKAFSVVSGIGFGALALIVVAYQIMKRLKMFA